MKEHLFNPNFSNEALRRDTMKFFNDRRRHSIKKFMVANRTKVEYSYHWGGNFYLGDCFTLQEFIELFEISKRTAQRWLVDPDSMPLWALRHLALITGAVMASTAFEGFYIVEGALYTPAGRKFEPGTLEGIQWKMQETEILRRDLNELREKYDTETHQLRLSADYWREKAGAPMASNDED